LLKNIGTISVRYESKCGKIMVVLIIICISKFKNYKSIFAGSKNTFIHLIFPRIMLRFSI
jgi:hypothetical protein